MIPALNWLADRIREIERFVSQLPSTVIFVNSEADVAPVAETLNAVLVEHNIQVVACPRRTFMYRRPIAFAGTNSCRLGSSTYTARTTDLVIDVMGYFSTQANDVNGQGLLFNSLGAPLRLLDSRAGQPACYTPGAKMVGGTVYTQETQIPCTNLTSTARGLVGNVSALNAAANGYLTFWPSNALQPTVATSNYQTGRVFNRHFTVGLGTDAAFKRFAASTTDVIIDISGFFAP